LSTSKPQATRNSLILGWQVTNAQDPRYWLSKDSVPGAQQESDLVQTPARTIGNHTVIIAQSGSGKSFFLGRLIEEIMLKTRAKCFIFDPNADFRRIRQVEDQSLWTDAAYKPLERRGKLPHEASREQFSLLWDQIPIRIRTGRSSTSQFRRTAEDTEYQQLRLWWPSLSMAFLAEDLNPMLRSDLYHCHAFVKALGGLVDLQSEVLNTSTNIIDEAQRIFRMSRQLPKQDLRTTLEQEFNAERILAKGKPFMPEDDNDWLQFGSSLLLSRSELHNNVKNFIESSLTLAEYVSPDVERYYFGKAREYQAAGILRTTSEEFKLESPVRLDVIDLPSLPDVSTRLLAINAVLNTVWDSVRRRWDRALTRAASQDTRSPTFIVVDEAHNLIPSNPRGKAESALREQFRTIVAEGRKYGLYLLLVSQRPDKLDPLVVSECENRAIMRIGSGTVLNITKQMLGLDDLSPKLLEKCLEFETGRALLIGPWAPDGYQIMYSAARRTVEGGRNLRDEYWAQPPPLTLPEREKLSTSLHSQSSAKKATKKLAKKR